MASLAEPGLKGAEAPLYGQAVQSAAISGNKLDW